MRTTPQSNAVGKTEAPTSIVITDGASEKVIKVSDKQQIYKLDLDDMKYISISVNGVGEAAKIRELQQTELRKASKSQKKTAKNLCA